MLIPAAELRGIRNNNKKMTTIDLLFEFSKVYHVDFSEGGRVMEVPKKIKDIETKLGLCIFPMQGI